MGHAEWVIDPRFTTMSARRENREAILSAVSEVLATQTTEHWTDRLTPLGVVAAGVETLEQALNSEHTAAREMVIAIDTLDGPIRAVGNPVRIDGGVSQYSVPPKLGEHGDTLLPGRLGHG